MSLRDVSLHDKYDLGKDRVLLNGTQALVRLMLMQRARDGGGAEHGRLRHGLQRLAAGRGRSADGEGARKRSRGRACEVPGA
jgi:hypothetical protein